MSLSTPSPRRAARRGRAPEATPEAAPQAAAEAAPPEAPGGPPGGLAAPAGAAGGPASVVPALLDALPGQVCVLDAEGTIVAVNAAWRALARRQPVDPAVLCEGSSYLAVCDAASAPTNPVRDGADDARVVGEALRSLLAGDRDQLRMEYTCPTPEGPRWFMLRLSRIAPVEGSRARVLVVHDDVTPVHQARVALRQRDRLLEDLAASIPGALFRLLQPARGPWHFVYLSPGFELLTELVPAEVCADRRLFDQLVVAEDRTTVATGIRQALASGQTWTQTYRVRTARSGRLRWLRVVSQPGRPGAPDEPRAWTGLISDVTEAHAVEQALREREETFRTLFETVPQGVVYQDTHGRITGANPAALRILGLTLDQLQGRNSIDPRWQAVREDGSALPGDEHPAMVALRTREPVTDVVMGVQVPGRGTVWILVGAIPILRDGVLQHVYTSFEDITEQVQLREELRRQAATDALTSVANRRSLMARLAEEFAHARRHPARVFSVLAVDIDLFKQVNDNWGHAAGDAALVHLSRVMQRQTRPSDLVGRSGGEEFMVLLRDADAGAAQALAERLRRAIARSALHHGGVRLRLSVSIGVAALRPDDAAVDALLARADRALYAAKHGGRNRVCLGEA